jgi:flagellar motor switch/type III secretory pathway protein FliN
VVQAAARARVAAVQARVDSINAGRKTAQEGAAGRLKTSSRRWHETVDTNVQISLACADAEQELKRLRRLAEQQGVALDAPAAGTAAVQPPRMETR